MAGEWVHCTLADACCAIDYGLTASASNQTAGPKFLRITDIVSGQPNWISVPHVAVNDEFTMKYRLYEGDIVIARTGASTGASAYIKNPPPSVFASYLVRLQVRPDFDSRFISYYLKSREFWDFIRGVLGDKSAQPNASASTMTAAPLSAPKGKAEQRAIANILGTLDDKIELNRRMNETLEAMARGLFKDWFVDFGPTRAKAESRDPYLAPEIWDLFPDKLDEDGKPEGWEDSKVEDYLELAYGKSLPAKSRRPGGVAVYGSGGLTGFHDEALIKGPAVIVGRKGTVGSLYWEDRPIFPIDTVFYVVPKRASLSFCYQLLLSQPLAHMNTDAAVPGLNRNNAYRLEFPWPGSRLTNTFESFASPLWKKRTASLREIDTLSQSRDLLLPKLMSGKIRVGDADKIVQEST